MQFRNMLKWVRARIGGMDEADSAAARERFVNAVADAQSARATILIREFDDLCGAVMDVLKAAGMTSEQASNMVRDSMHAVCPNCGWISTGRDLVSLWLMEAIGFERLGGLDGRRAVGRLARGICPSGRCFSRVMTVVWQPSLFTPAEEDREPPPA